VKSTNYEASYDEVFLRPAVNSSLKSKYSFQETDELINTIITYCDGTLHRVKHGEYFGITFKRKTITARKTVS
jgi:hypothetical protein